MLIFDKEIKGVIFDMDGTLVHNMQFHDEVWLAFFAKYGYDLSLEELNAVHYGSMLEILPRVFGDKFSLEELVKLGEEKEAMYRSAYAHHITEINGLSAFILKLKSNNVKIALATMAQWPNINFTLKALGIEHEFDTIINADHVTKGKPDPEIFIKACENLGTKPQDCILFEDSASGLSAGIASGCHTIGVIGTLSQMDITNLGIDSIVDYTLFLDDQSIS